MRSDVKLKETIQIFYRLRSLITYLARESSPIVEVKLKEKAYYELRARLWRYRERENQLHVSSVAMDNLKGEGDCFHLFGTKFTKAEG